ncbi:MAG TPA: CarD family transcriptional regulator, partial [Verrucomicrobiae bacterium]|nr:CarD family transcriptional regulator [Verrucomicrobiae bacterium]
MRLCRTVQGSGATLVQSILRSVLQTPAMQQLCSRLEQGGVLSWPGIHPVAQPFLALALARSFPARTIVAVTDGVKTQESFHQDLETWLALGSGSAPSAPSRPPLYYPSWEILPHESKLPHADIISERLQTIVALTQSGVPPQTIVTNVGALLQKTFPAEDLRRNTRTFKRGDRIEPLDLIEWLEEQGYEPEAQVTSKGEIALRGGILDVYPLPSPWPVRIEFFGDEIDSMRHFDPHTQISRENIDSVSIPPSGELAFLKQNLSRGADKPMSTLLEYIPDGSLLLLCEPASILEAAEKYETQVPANDPFFCSWRQFLDLAETRGFPILNVFETAAPERFAGFESEAPQALQQLAASVSALPEQPFLNSLEAFRPQPSRAAELPVAEAQRREFFGQLHRWLRQDYQLHVLCNNEGERQRFQEIWAEYGLDPADSTLQPRIEIGSLSRGFICEEAKVVVVTDAEIFGRYKVSRPRRLKSPHAAATRSALDIDFGDLEPGNFVVHLQHGIGKYLGLEILPGGRGKSTAPSTRTEAAAASESAGPECLVIEYAPSDFDQPAPKLYVPVTEAHLVSKYVGTGKARPPLHTLGGTRWQKAKVQAEEAVRDLASDLLAMQAARESLPGHSFGEDTPWQREFESSFIYEETPDQAKAISAAKKDMESTKPMDRLICGDVGYGKTEVAIRAAFKSVMGGKQ